MTQIQERFARIARHNAETAPAASKTAFEPDQCMVGANNLGKVTRFTPSHAQRAAKIRAEIAEQRSMELPKRGDKAWFLSIVAAWSAVIGVAIWTALS